MCIEQAASFLRSRPRYFPPRCHARAIFRVDSSIIRIGSHVFSLLARIINADRVVVVLCSIP